MIYERAYIVRKNIIYWYLTKIAVLNSDKKFVCLLIIKIKREEELLTTECSALILIYAHTLKRLNNKYQIFLKIVIIYYFTLDLQFLE